MKVILETSNLDPNLMRDFKYNKETRILSFKYKERVISAEVMESLTTYVKVFEDDSVELINMEAKQCFN